MPKNTFKGQNEDYRNPVSSTVFITSKDVPEKVVDVLKTLVDNKTYIARAASGTSSGILPPVASRRMPCWPCIPAPSSARSAAGSSNRC